MSNLGRGINLEPGIEKLQRLARLFLLALAILRRRRPHMQELQHLPPEFGRMGTTRDAELDAGGREALQDRGDLAVQGKGLAYFVGAGAVGGVGAQGWGYVRVYPEWP